jgi:hypothetical protein
LNGLSQKHQSIVGNNDLPEGFLLVNNFLGENLFSEIKKNIEGVHFAWYFFSDTIYGLENQNDSSKLGFRHAIVLDNRPNTPHYELYATVPMKVADAVGGKLHSTQTFHANLTLNHGANEEAANWKLRWMHIDGFMELETEHLKRYTAIIYVDDSDGNTVFFDNETKEVIYEQTPKQNTALIFPTDNLHAGDLPRICNQRRVLNVNILVDIR